LSTRPILAPFVIDILNGKKFINSVKKEKLEKARGKP
jgi:hypothetical protein